MTTEEMETIGYRGATAEPGVPSPQEEVPLVDPKLQELINKVNFAEVPEAQATEGTEEIKVIAGRPARLDPELNVWVDVETGKPVEEKAYGGLVFGAR